MLKTMVHTLFIALLLCSTVALADGTSKTLTVKKSDIVTKTIGVRGMTCVGCEVSLERAMKKVHGVVKVKASASGKNAVIAYDKTKTDEATVTQMIENFGYKPFKAVEKK